MSAQTPRHSARPLARPTSLCIHLRLSLCLPVSVLAREIHIGSSKMQRGQPASRRRDLWNAVSFFGLKLRLLKIVNDIILTTCDQQITVLLCLEITAAFDTV